MADNKGSLNLWNDGAQTEYGKDHQDLYLKHIMEQYKLYVELADRISSRRNLANTFFLSVHTFLIGALGYVLAHEVDIKPEWILAIPLVAAQALCYTWYRLVKSYRQLNTGKFKVIGEFETKLPASPWQNAEWKALGEGKDPSLYRPLTDVENWVPVTFSILYLLAFLFMIFRNMIS